VSVKLDLFVEEDALRLSAGRNAWTAPIADIREVWDVWPSEGREPAPLPIHFILYESQFWLVPEEAGPVGPILNALPNTVLRREGDMTGMPWRLRKAGFLGLRLWPEARAGAFPLSALPDILFTDSAT
jgi:hypothetical protein